MINSLIYSSSKSHYSFHFSSSLFFLLPARRFVFYTNPFSFPSISSSISSNSRCIPPSTLRRDLCQSHLHAAVPFLRSTPPSLSHFLSGVLLSPLPSTPLFCPTPINYTQHPFASQSPVRRSFPNPSDTTVNLLRVWTKNPTCSEIFQKILKFFDENSIEKWNFLFFIFVRKFVTKNRAF